MRLWFGINGLIKRLVTMKRIALVIAFFCCCCSLHAQFHSGSNHAQKAVGIGVVGAANLASFAYPNDISKDSLGFDSLLYRIRPVIGLTVEIPIGNYLYVAPEVLLASRGDSRLFESTVWDASVRYQAKVNYLELRVPVSFAIPVSKTVHPYVFAAPSFGLTLPMGAIVQHSLDNPQSFDHAVAIDSSNMALYDAGVMAGAGVRFNVDFSTFSLVFKLEGGYYYGLLDTYSPLEHNDQASAANVTAYNILDKRQNRGIECRLSIVLPLKFLPGDACSSFSSKNRTRHRLGSYGF